MSADLRHAALAIRSLDPESLDRVVASLSRPEAVAIDRCWQLHARPKQLRPEGCAPIWLVMSGRGFGKTRLAAENTLDRCEDWGPALRGVIASKTIGDTREDMVLGDSGIVACARRRGYDVRYIPSRAVIEHPAGGVLRLTSGEIPDGCRGPNVNFFWGDEIAHWKRATAVLDNLMWCWRLPGPNGEPPEGVFTTTPRPSKIMHRLVTSDEFAGRVTITQGSTLENSANLSPDAIKLYRDVYEGTRLGEQEMMGRLLQGLGTIVDQDTIHANRVRRVPEWRRGVISVDPAISDDEGADQAGIAAVVEADGHAYILEAQGYERGKSVWARKAVELAVEFGIPTIVAETNQGKDYIPEDIRVAAKALSEELGREIVVRVEEVWQSKSKRARATPVGALYERGRVHHVGVFRTAERELTSWIEGEDSPNVMDSIVQGVTHLLLAGPRSTFKDYL